MFALVPVVAEAPQALSNSDHRESLEATGQRPVVDQRGNFNVRADVPCSGPPSGACFNFISTGKPKPTDMGSVGLRVMLKQAPDEKAGIVALTPGVILSDSPSASGPAWAENPSIDTTPQTTSGAVGSEIDVNVRSEIEACNSEGMKTDGSGRRGCAFYDGLLVTGNSFRRGGGDAFNAFNNPGSAAVRITGDPLQNAGGKPQVQWADGIIFAGPYATQNRDILSTSNSDVVLQDAGRHRDLISANGRYSGNLIEYFAGRLRFRVAGDGSVETAGTFGLGRYPVSALPSVCTPGQEAYATDARKPGEAAGSGSGVPVVCTLARKGGAPQWWTIAPYAVARY